VEPGAVLEAERRANDIVFENRPVRWTSKIGRGEGAAQSLDREGTLRVCSIDGLDRSACGGTHVRATGGGRFSYASSTKCGRPSVWNSCAAGGRCGGARGLRSALQNGPLFRRLSRKSRHGGGAVGNGARQR